MFKGLTSRCSKIINEYAVLEAKYYKHAIIHPEHILVAMLKEGQSNAYTVMNQIVDLIHFQLIIESHMNKMKEDEIARNIDILLYYNISLTVTISNRTKLVIQNAIDEARRVGSQHVDTFALFLACCEEEESISRAIIMRHEVLLEDFRKHYFSYIKTQSQKNTQDVEKTIQNNKFLENSKISNTDSNEDAQWRQKGDTSYSINDPSINKLVQDIGISSEDINKNNTSPPAHRKEHKIKPNIELHEKPQHKFEYLHNLTKAVCEKKYTHIFGRNQEIEKIFRVLLRKKKNNPVLVGDSGVGKTAIVEEIALRISEGTVPVPLLDTEILQLELSSLTAGTRYRGDFEERLLMVIEELTQRATNNKKTILFIDEFHHIIGAGLANGLSMDGAGILKPALARGDVCCIGVTTAEEYRKYIEPDKSFVRRLQKVEISEMSDEETCLTLNKIKSEFEQRHNVVYSNEAIDEIIRLSKNYIFDRSFPDKAIDILDDVGGYYQLKNSDPPKQLQDLYSEEKTITAAVDTEINSMKSNTDYVIDNKKLKEAHRLHSVIDERKKLQNRICKEVQKNKQIIRAAEVREVITLNTGIPSDRLDKSKSKIVQDLEKSLHKTIVGQPNAIQSLVFAVKRSSVGLHQANRPMGSFMFLGPTGVGKTYTAKQLAKYLFGKESFLTRFDMSDFSESNSVSRLIGAPPGYVGYEENGLLINSVRRTPHQLMLFDEVEKAHNKVYDLFLQILEEGCLQSHTGLVADFRHCLIVMTSNIGSKELLLKKNFGFNDGEYNSEFIRTTIEEELQQNFRPELINRFDEFVVFNPLGQSEIVQVIALMIQELQERMSYQGVHVAIHPQVHTYVYDNFYQSEYGSRSIRRGIRAIENYLAEVIIDKNVKAGDNLSLMEREGKLVVRRMSSKEKPTRKKVLSKIPHR